MVRVGQSLPERCHRAHAQGRERGARGGGPAVCPRGVLADDDVRTSKTPGHFVRVRARSADHSPEHRNFNFVGSPQNAIPHFPLLHKNRSTEMFKIDFAEVDFVLGQIAPKPKIEEFPG